MSAIEAARTAFIAAYGHEPSFVVRAPGRVNIIGEHTDYNDGFVFPIALPFDTAIVADPRSDRGVQVASIGFGSDDFRIDDDPRATIGWARYLHGMAAALAAEGHEISGWQGMVATTIPAGAGLSSSAALEIAAGLMLSTAAGGTVDPTELAHMGRWVENELFGLPSGILDQLASATGKSGSASLIDCRDLSVEHVPLPAETTIVVMDTGTRRQLVESEYADRQATCVAAARKLGLASLRDATLIDLNRLDGIELVRARHVITENQRTLQAADAMRAGDAPRLGALMNSSHESLRGDYDVSGPALDEIVRVARAAPGCLGARMTGGGFAGCAIALVETALVEPFQAGVVSHFEPPAAQPAAESMKLYAVQAGAGASVERSPA